MTNELEGLYQKAQDYLKKNILDLQVPIVKRALGVVATETRTPCRNFWTLPCEVTHAAIRLEVYDEWADYRFDHVEFMEIYSCDGYWAANFLLVPPKEPLTAVEAANALDELPNKIKQAIEWTEDELRERLDHLRVVREKNHLEHISSLKVLGGTRLFKISKTPSRDAKWISEMYWLVRSRYISLFHPSVKINWDSNYFHEPVRDPHLDDQLPIDSNFRRRELNSVEKLAKYFYTI